MTYGWEKNDLSVADISADCLMWFLATGVCLMSVLSGFQASFDCCCFADYQVARTIL